MAYLGIVSYVKAGKGRSNAGMENVAGMVHWVLFVNLGGREKPMKISGRMIGSGLCFIKYQGSSVDDRWKDKKSPTGQLGYHLIQNLYQIGIGG